MERWTSRDEEELQRLMKRKETIMSQNMRQLIQLIVDEQLNGGSVEHIAEALAANADAFRDALKPFDSGVRCATESPN